MCVGKIVFSCPTTFASILASKTFVTGENSLLHLNLTKNNAHPYNRISWIVACVVNVNKVRALYL